MMGKVPSEGLTVSELLHLAFQVFYKRIKLTILALLQLFIPVYLQFRFSFVPHDVSNYESRYQWL